MARWICTPSGRFRDPRRVRLPHAMSHCVDERAHQAPTAVAVHAAGQRMTRRSGLSAAVTVAVKGPRRRANGRRNPGPAPAVSLGVDTSDEQFRLRQVRERHRASRSAFLLNASDQIGLFWRRKSLSLAKIQALETLFEGFFKCCQARIAGWTPFRRAARAVAAYRRRASVAVRHGGGEKVEPPARTPHPIRTTHTESDPGPGDQAVEGAREALLVGFRRPRAIRGAQSGQPLDQCLRRETSRAAVGASSNQPAAAKSLERGRQASGCRATEDHFGNPGSRASTARSSVIEFEHVARSPPRSVGRGQVPRAGIARGAARACVEELHARTRLPPSRKAGALCLIQLA